MRNTDPRVVQRIEAMTPQEQEELIVRLTDYAAWLMRQKTYWMERSVLPKGYEAGSLATEAISRVLEGSRKWDPDKDPDLLGYLRSVVKSILWDLQKAAEKESLVEPAPGETRDLVDTLPSAKPGPDEDVALGELQERLLAELETDEDRLVLLSIFEGNEAAREIAEDLGVTVAEVYRIKRKIKRRLMGLKDGE